MPHFHSRRRPQQPAIKHIARDPSASSRLADIGYIDRKGGWHAIVNILDQSSCQHLGIQPIHLASGLQQYITTQRVVPSYEPLVELYNGSDKQYQLVTPSELARLVGRAQNSTDYTSQVAECTLGLLIYPKRNQTTTVFIAGQKMFTRTLHLPNPVLEDWLTMYSPQVNRFATKSIELFPPARPAALCLCLTEYYSEAWKTIHIRADSKASPLALGWKPPTNSLPGLWIVFESPQSGTVVRAGFSSSRNGTKWIIGGDGIRVPLRSKFNVRLFCGSTFQISKKQLERESLRRPIQPPQNLAE
jgi:hypothetical protein